MSKLIHRLFALLALVAIGHAQVFGLAQKYVCVLNGIAYVTDADHHHKSLGLEPSHFDHYVPHSHDHDHDHDGTAPDDTEKHLPVKVELSPMQIAASVSAPAVPFVAVCELPDFLALLVASTPSTEEPSLLLSDPGGRSSPPPSVLVVRSTIILV